jgi:GTPase SAR1 family protein
MSGLSEIRTGELSFSAGRTPNILLVCGPSGSGKSTFINEMLEGRLSPELAAVLPDTAFRWPIIEANDLLKHQVGFDELAAASQPEVGLILHYDTFFVQRAGILDYFDDPVSKILLQAPNLMIVHIKPTPNQLKAQFDKRLQSQLKRKGLAKGLWARFVRKPMKGLKRRLFGVGLPYTEDLYTKPNCIEGCYRDWETFLQSLVGSRQSTSMIQIMPGGNEKKEDFLLLRPNGVSIPHGLPGRDAPRAVMSSAV